VYGSNESNKACDEHTVTPFSLYLSSLEEEKHGGSHHGHRANEKSKAYVITRLDTGKKEGGERK
jgi:hypothetical protein